MTGAATQPVLAVGAAAVADDAHWEEIARRAPQMAVTMHAYLDQLAVSSRPSTVQAAALALRHLAEHITQTCPNCTSGPAPCWGAHALSRTPRSRPRADGR
jgi:hypothetical protein